MSECIFCRIVAGDAPAHLVYEDGSSIAFMDINPATDGHCLVVPRTHADDLWSLADEDGAAVWRAVRRVAEAVREALKPDGLNLLQSNGVAALQTVFHFHVHVVPRYRDDGIHVPLMRAPGNRSELEYTAARIRSAF